MNKLQRRVLKIQKLWDDTPPQSPQVIEAGDFSPKSMGFKLDQLSGQALEYVLTAIVPKPTNLSFTLLSVADFKKNSGESRDLASLAIKFGFLLLAYDEDFFYLSNTEGAEVQVLPHDALTSAGIDYAQAERSYKGIDTWLDAMIRREKTKAGNADADEASYLQKKAESKDAWQQYIDIMRAHPDPNYTGITGRSLLIEFLLGYHLRSASAEVRLQGVRDELDRGADPNFQYGPATPIILAAHFLPALPLLLEAGASLCTEGIGVHLNKRHYRGKKVPFEFPVCDCTYCTDCISSHPPGPCPLELHCQHFLAYQEIHSNAIKAARAFKRKHRDLPFFDPHRTAAEALSTVKGYMKTLKNRMRREMYDGVRKD